MCTTGGGPGAGGIEGSSATVQLRGGGGLLGTGAPWKMPGELTESIGVKPIELLKPLGGALDSFN